MSTPSDLCDAILSLKQPSHNTLYCNHYHEEQIIGEALDSRTATHLNPGDIKRVFGLELIVMERFEYPIVCEKGEVFDLVEDFK